MLRQQSSVFTSSVRVSWFALALSSGACGVDVPLGELEPEANPPLVDEGPTGSTPVYGDGIAPARVGAPDVTLGVDDLSSTIFGNTSVGDLDDDGFDEMAVVIYDNAGNVFVQLRYGGARPANAVDAFAFGESGARLVVGTASDSRVSVSGLHAAGDIDGDGYTDLFVQTIRCGRSGVEGPGGYLLYGGPERWTGTQDLRTIASHLATERTSGAACANYSFAAPGDIDGDGFADLAMSSVESNPSDPDVYVIYGRAARFASAGSWREEAELRVSVDPSARQELHAGGDIDGDGLPELLIRYAAQSAADSRVVVVRGSTTRATGTLGLLSLQPQIQNSQLGADAAPISSQAVGDLDGDGNADFVVDGRLFYGSAELLAGPLELSQAAATLPEGRLVPVGDRDGDGDDELLVVSFVEDETYASWPVQPEISGGMAVSTLSGSSTRLSGTVPLAAEPSWEGALVYPDDWSRVFQRVMPAGDLDNDGASEVITMSAVAGELGAPPQPQMHIHYGVHVPPAPGASPH